MVSQALRVATDLNVADRLVAGERSVDDLAEETHCHCDALYRIMRLLAAEGVFSETSARRFQLTELGAALLSDAPSSPRDLIRMMNREPYLAFAQLTHSVQRVCRRSKPYLESPGSIGWRTIRTRPRYSSRR
ncbi:hypothetical protein P0R27_13145 [Bradyrhizobium yuanmingense]|nr:hypothetical protein [Bradyrhizobium yuanmingense]MDF0494248.1 hypothetical protein [Bradyrhizobium yuanmingense]